MPDTGTTIADQTPAQRANMLRAGGDQFRAFVQHFTIGGHQPEYLAKLVELAKAHHVRLALVVSPLHPSFYTYLDKPSDWQTITNYWSSFAAAEGVPYYDASHLPGYSDADFVDPHHLSLSGAEKFSSWLASAIVGPAFGQR